MNTIVIVYSSIFLITLGYVNHLVMNNLAVEEIAQGSIGMKLAFCVLISVFWFIFWPLVVLIGAGLILNDDKK